MRKVFVYLLSMALTGGLLCACSNTSQGKTEMYIEPAQLTNEERSIAELLGLDAKHHIFDFVVDDSVKSYQINTWQLVNGNWQMQTGDGGYTLTDTSGRIALGFDKLAEGIRVATQSEHGGGSSSYEREHDEKFDDMSYATAMLSAKTEIVYGKELPLAVQIMTSKNKIISYDVEYFEHPEEYEKFGYEGVFAVTVCFSQEL